MGTIDKASKECSKQQILNEIDRTPTSSSAACQSRLSGRVFRWCSSCRCSHRPSWAWRYLLGSDLAYSHLPYQRPCLLPIYIKRKLPILYVRINSEIIQFQVKNSLIWALELFQIKMWIKMLIAQLLYHYWIISCYTVVILKINDVQLKVIWKISRGNLNIYLHTFSFLLKNRPSDDLRPFFFCAAAAAATAAAAETSRVTPGPPPPPPMPPTPVRVFLCSESWLLWREDIGDGGVCVCIAWPCLNTLQPLHYSNLDRLIGYPFIRHTLTPTEQLYVQCKVSLIFHLAGNKQICQLCHIK